MQCLVCADWLCTSIHFSPLGDLDKVALEDWGILEYVGTHPCVVAAVCHGGVEQACSGAALGRVIR